LTSPQIMQSVRQLFCELTSVRDLTGHKLLVGRLSSKQKGNTVGLTSC